MTTKTKRVNLFKPQTHLVKPMGDVFVKAEFERDLGEFLKKFIVTEPELTYLKKEPAELIPAVEMVSFAGVREGVYKCLAVELGVDINLIPERFEYHFGNFYGHLELIKPIESRLLVDPIVQKHLTWQGRADLEVNCDNIAHEINRGYRVHLMEPRRPKSF
ncbi:MAG: hypothetical protein Q8R00_00320 [Candidatus Nanoarchaeia archaeon]|nr:hypothetical protein [Candidatus Nanoarchaeia archaeon]